MRYNVLVIQKIITKSSASTAAGSAWGRRYLDRAFLDDSRRPVAVASSLGEHEEEPVFECDFCLPCFFLVRN